MDRADALREVVDDLARRHPLFARLTIERLVTRTFDEYADAPIQAFVPLLVRRIVTRRLTDLDHDYPGPRTGPASPVVAHQAP